MGIKRLGWSKAHPITEDAIEFFRSLRPSMKNYGKVYWMVKATESYREKKWPKARKGE